MLCQGLEVHRVSPHDVGDLNKYPHRIILQNRFDLHVVSDVFCVDSFDLLCLTLEHLHHHLRLVQILTQARADHILV